MTASDAPLVPAYAERRENCRRYEFGGGIWIVLADSARTAGHIANLEAIYQQGGGLPRRIHEREAEMAYVIAGRVRFQIGDAPQATALPGTLIFVPAGVAHSLTADEDGTRIYYGFIPAGIEELIVTHGVPTERMILEPHGAPFDGRSRSATAFGLFNVLLYYPE